MLSLRDTEIFLIERFYTVLRDGKGNNVTFIKVLKNRFRTNMGKTIVTIAY